MEQKNDVRHQRHYEATAIQPIEYMRATMDATQYEGYLRGNVIKYISRYPHKGGLEDLRKAQVYLEWLIAHMGREDALEVQDNEYKPIIAHLSDSDEAD